MYSPLEPEPLRGLLQGEERQKRSLSFLYRRPCLAKTLLHGGGISALLAEYQGARTGLRHGVTDGAWGELWQAQGGMRES